MQINNNLNSMMQLERNLEKSADAVSKINIKNQQTNQSDQNTNITQEMVKQIEIPLAYTANAQVISTQDSITQSILDIKA